MQSQHFRQGDPSDSGQRLYAAGPHNGRSVSQYLSHRVDRDVPKERLITPFCASACSRARSKTCCILASPFAVRIEDCMFPMLLPLIALIAGILASPFLEPRSVWI